MDVELIEFGGENDHVHLMVCCPPKLAVSNLVGKLKGEPPDPKAVRKSLELTGKK